MTNPILITGCGVVSAIGNNKAETLDALLHNRSGVGELVYATDRKGLRAVAVIAAVQSADVDLDEVSLFKDPFP